MLGRASKPKARGHRPDAHGQQPCARCQAAVSVITKSPFVGSSKPPAEVQRAAPLWHAGRAPCARGQVYGGVDDSNSSAPCMGGLHCCAKNRGVPRNARLIVHKLDLAPKRPRQAPSGTGRPG